MTIIHSSDKGLINQELKKLIGSDYENYSFIVYRSIDQLIDLLHGQSMFDSNEKKYVISDCVFLTDANEADLTQDLIHVLKLNRSASVYLTVEGDKLLTKHSLISQLLKEINVISLNKLTNYTMHNRITSMLEANGIKLTLSQLNLFMNRLVPNAMIIANEIEKLKYFKPNEVTDELLQNLIFEYNNDSVFKLVELLLSRNAVAAIKLYDSLVNHMFDPLEILQIMSTQILKIIMLSRALKANMHERDIIKDLGLNSFQFTATKKICKYASLSQLEKVLNGILKTDIKIKRFNLDSYNSVRFFLSKELQR